jgi:hypothetical protein
VSLCRWVGDARPVKPAGPAVTWSSNTAQKPTFTAPEVEVQTQLTFGLVVTDSTSGLHDHNPANSVSTSDSVTITVNP